MALIARHRSGKGQHVEASLCQTATYHQTPYVLDYEGAVSDEPRGYEALGTSHLNRFYRAQDGWFFVAARPEDTSHLCAIEGLHVDELDPRDAGKIERTLEEAFSHTSVSVWIGWSGDPRRAWSRRQTGSVGEILGVANP